MKNSKKSKENRNALKRSFYNDLSAGNFKKIPETVREMRKITGFTQPEFAKWIGIAPRVLIDIERGVGNPTLKTLEKIIEPFGLAVGFVRKRDVK